MKISSLQVLAAGFVALIFASCTPSSPQSVIQPKTSFQYTASKKSGLRNLPRKLYVLPPLLADRSGRPKSQMRPVTDETGQIVGWSSPDKGASQLHRRVCQAFKDEGYQIVDYSEVTSMSHDYVIGVVSTFYTAAEKTKPVEGSPFDSVVLTMMRVKVFEKTLDPESAIEVARADGIAHTSGTKHYQALVQQSMIYLARETGDDVSGHARW